jgi:hypothetical protein
LTVYDRIVTQSSFNALVSSIAQNVFDHRHRIEGAAIVLLALLAGTLEVLGVDSVGGRDPFRILFPALTALVGWSVLELVGPLQDIREAIPISKSGNRREKLRGIAHPDDRKVKRNPSSPGGSRKD